MAEFPVNPHRFDPYKIFTVAQALLARRGGRLSGRWIEGRSSSQPGST